LTRNTAGRGLVAHTAVLHALVRKNFEVLLPWADHLAYDIAYYYSGEEGIDSIDGIEPRFVRVQCKMARMSADGGVIQFNAYRVSPGDNGRRSVKKGYRGEAEYFGVYSPDTDKVYMVPVDEVPEGINVRLRLKQSKNNQEKFVRWAKDYEF
jgi:hypothetical protein